MENVRPAPEQALVNFGRTTLVALLAFVLLTSGCAQVHGNRHGQAGRASLVHAPAGDHFIPIADEAEAIEPTVVAPTVVAYDDYRDPLIRFNRVVFAFNDVTYRYALIPLSKRYVSAVPEPARQSIGNFFANLKTPIHVANHLIQLQTKPLVRSLQRFGVNSTIGILGLFDPARDRYGLARSETDFEDTLIHYNAGYGIYLVLPIFGASDIRNGLSLVVDYFLNPIPYLLDSPASLVVQGFDRFQESAPEAEQYEIFRRESEDPYLFIRNLYLQGIQRDIEYTSRGTISVSSPTCSGYTKPPPPRQAGPLPAGTHPEHIVSDVRL
jgi:phospholipid-binding lipoprotein MlaA